MFLFLQHDPAEQLEIYREGGSGILIEVPMTWLTYQMVFKYYKESYWATNQVLHLNPGQPKSTQIG